MFQDMIVPIGNYGGISDEVVTVRYYGASNVGYYYFRDINGTTASEATQISYNASSGSFDCPFFTITKVSGGHLFNAVAKKDFRVIANAAASASSDNVTVTTISAGTTTTSEKLQIFFGVDNSYNTYNISEV